MKTWIFVLLFAPVILWAQAPSPDWQKRIPAYSGNGATTLCQLPDGGYFLVAMNDNSQVARYHNFGFDATDIMVTRVNSGGNVIWQKCYGGNSSEINPAIIHAPNGNYMITA